MTQNKKMILISILFLTFFTSFSQASWSTYLAFRLIDEKGKFIDRDTFQKEYKIANVFGNIINIEDENSNFIRFDNKTKYFIVTLTTIGPRYSFALYKGNDIMTFHIPHKKKNQIGYAIQKLEFSDGDYLMDFKFGKIDKITFHGEKKFNIIKKVNWKKQSKRLLKSKLFEDRKIYRKTLEK